MSLPPLSGLRGPLTLTKFAAEYYDMKVAYRSHQSPPLTLASSSACGNTSPHPSLLCLPPLPFVLYFYVDALAPPPPPPLHGDHPSYIEDGDGGDAGRTGRGLRHPHHPLALNQFAKVLQSLQEHQHCRPSSSGPSWTLHFLRCHHSIFASLWWQLGRGTVGRAYGFLEQHGAVMVQLQPSGGGVCVLGRVMPHHTPVGASLAAAAVVVEEDGVGGGRGNGEHRGDKPGKRKRSAYRRCQRRAKRQRTASLSASASEQQSTVRKRTKTEEAVAGLLHAVRCRPLFPPPGSADASSHDREWGWAVRWLHTAWNERHPASGRAAAVQMGLHRRTIARKEEREAAAVREGRYLSPPLIPIGLQQHRAAACPSGKHFSVSQAGDEGGDGTAAVQPSHLSLIRMMVRSAARCNTRGAALAVTGKLEADYLASQQQHPMHPDGHDPHRRLPASPMNVMVSSSCVAQYLMMLLSSFSYRPSEGEAESHTATDLTTTNGSPRGRHQDPQQRYFWGITKADHERHLRECIRPLVEHWLTTSSLSSFIDIPLERSVKGSRVWWLKHSGSSSSPMRRSRSQQALYASVLTFCFQVIIPFFLHKSFHVVPSQQQHQCAGGIGSSSSSGLGFSFVPLAIWRRIIRAALLDQTGGGESAAWRLPAPALAPASPVWQSAVSFLPSYKRGRGTTLRIVASMVRRSSSSASTGSSRAGPGGGRRKRRELMDALRCLEYGAVRAAVLEGSLTPLTCVPPAAVRPSAPHAPSSPGGGGSSGLLTPRYHTAVTSAVRRRHLCFPQLHGAASHDEYMAWRAMAVHCRQSNPPYLALLRADGLACFNQLKQQAVWEWVDSRLAPFLPSSSPPSSRQESRREAVREEAAFSFAYFSVVSPVWSSKDGSLEAAPHPGTVWTITLTSQDLQCGTLPCVPAQWILTELVSGGSDEWRTAGEVYALLKAHLVQHPLCVTLPCPSAAGSRALRRAASYSGGGRPGLPLTQQQQLMLTCHRGITQGSPVSGLVCEGVLQQYLDGPLMAHLLAPYGEESAYLRRMDDILVVTTSPAAAAEVKATVLAPQGRSGSGSAGSWEDTVGYVPNIEKTQVAISSSPSVGCSSGAAATCTVSWCGLLLSCQRETYKNEEGIEGECCWLEAAVDWKSRPVPSLSFPPGSLRMHTHCRRRRSPGSGSEGERCALQQLRRLLSRAVALPLWCQLSNPPRRVLLNLLEVCMAWSRSVLPSWLLAAPYHPIGAAAGGGTVLRRPAQQTVSWRPLWSALQHFLQRVAKVMVHSMLGIEQRLRASHSSSGGVSSPIVVAWCVWTAAAFTIQQLRRWFCGRSSPSSHRHTAVGCLAGRAKGAGCGNSLRIRCEGRRVNRKVWWCLLLMCHRRAAALAQQCAVGDPSDPPQLPMTSEGQSVGQKKVVDLIVAESNTLSVQSHSLCWAALQSITSTKKGGKKNAKEPNDGSRVGRCSP